jgi:hypothetical protein
MPLQLPDTFAVSFLFFVTLNNGTLPTQEPYLTFKFSLHKEHSWLEAIFTFFHEIRATFYFRLTWSQVKGRKAVEPTIVSGFSFLSLSSPKSLIAGYV